MNYRYEIKVPISQYNEIIYLNWFLSLRNIRIHNPPREINNIYFDNLNFSSAQNNIDGISERAKFRVRWYEKDSILSVCNIELKIKDGKLNRKITIPTKLSHKEILSSDFFDLIKDNLNKIDFNHRELCTQKFLPIVQNKYNRTYYLYKDIRMTYDTKVNYKNLKIKSINNWNSDKLNVLEIKFNEKQLNQAQELISRMPFVPKRHSKYLRGLSYCKMAVYI